MIVRQALRLTAIGLVLGLAGAFVVARLISSLLFAVEPTDPPTFITACSLLVAAAILASYLPARRAMNVDPAVALRAE